MPNNSSTGGYLSPQSTPAPIEDATLAIFIQNFIVGITALAGTLVFPRWQVIPPQIPSVTTNWASAGVVNRKADTYDFEWHDPTQDSGNGESFIYRNEELEILCSFYGPNAESYATILRDGVQLGQNREVLLLNGFALIDVGDITQVPSLLNNQWYNRMDVAVNLRRAVLRGYAILSLLSGEIQLNTDTPPATETINIT